MSVCIIVSCKYGSTTNKYVIRDLGVHRPDMEALRVGTLQSKDHFKNIIYIKTCILKYFCWLGNAILSKFE